MPAGTMNPVNFQLMMIVATLMIMIIYNYRYDVVKVDALPPVNMTHHMHPYYPRNFSVYDAIMYNGEAQLFYLRLRLLDPYVDHFVVGYSCTSFQGDLNPPFSFAPLEAEIAEYADKIHIFENCNRNTKQEKIHSWERESRLRNFMKDCIDTLHPHPEDLVINCDCDEFPTQKGLEMIYAKPPDRFYKFRGLYFMYNFNWILENETWIKASILRYREIKSLQNMRKDGRKKFPEISLVHCTYCFPEVKSIIRKLKSFCHHEYAFEPYINPNYIVASNMCGKGLISKDAERLRPYKGDINEFVPFSHPEIDYLKQKVGFRDIGLTDPVNLSHFMKLINCSKDVKI